MLPVARILYRRTGLIRTVYDVQPGVHGSRASICSICYHGSEAHAPNNARQPHKKRTFSASLPIRTGRTHPRMDYAAGRTIFARVSSRAGAAFVPGDLQDPGVGRGSVYATVSGGGL